MAQLRERMIKNKLYRVVLWIILFSMGGGTLLFSPMLFRQMRTARPVIATVNGADIMYKEFEQKLAQEHERQALIRQQYGQYADVIMKMLGLDNPEEVALKTLINERLVSKVADALSLDLSSDFIMHKLSDPKFVLAELREIIPFQALDQRGVINFAALQQILHLRGQSMSDFEKQIEETLKRKIVIDLVSTSAYVWPQELEEHFKTHYLGKKYDILTFPLEKYLKEVKQNPLSDTEIKEFFEAENKASKRYWLPERRSGIIWEFNPEEYGISVTDEEMQQYYTKHKQEFLESPVKISINRILFKAGEDTAQKAAMVKEELTKNPARFGDLAKEHSDDKESAKKGGSIGFIDRTYKDPSIWRAALHLKNDGDISDIIQSAEGFEIIQRVDRKAATYKSLDLVKKDITQKIRNQKFKHQFQDEAGRAIDALKQDEHAIEAFINAKKGKKEVLEHQELTESPIVQKMFKTKKDAWTTLVQKDGNGVLVKVTDIEKSKEPSLEEAKEQVKQDIYLKQARIAQDQVIKQAQEAARTEDLLTLKKRLGIRSTPTDWIKRKDTESIERLEKEGIPARQLFATEKTPGVAYGDDAAYLAIVTEQEPFDKAAFNAKKTDLKKELYQEKKERISRAFVASLHKNATIELREEESGKRREISIDDIIF